MRILMMKTCVAFALFSCLYMPLYAARVSEAEITQVGAAMPGPVEAQKTYRVLCFSKPYGYPHASIHIAKEMARQMAQNTGLFHVDFSEDAAELSAANLANYDAVYLNNTTKMEKGLSTPEARKAFTDFVRNGGGLVAVHAATDGGWPEYVDMLGGDFDGHPWGANGTYTIANEDPGHPLVEAIFNGGAFRLNDELYQYKDFDRSKVRVLLSVDMSVLANHMGGMKRADLDYPMAWVRDFGKGRVFVSSLGHNKHVYHSPDILKMFLQGFRWVLGEIDVDTSSKAKPDSVLWVEKPEKQAELVRPRSESESLDEFVIQDDYSLERVAGDDMLNEPVLCVWDGNGRMYVAQMETYMQDVDGSDTITPRSRVLRLEDTNGDGIMDRRSVFAKDLLLPRIVLPLKERVLIGETNTNDIYAYRDTDDDGVSDEKVLWYAGGKRGGNLEHQHSGLIWALDNNIYLARGNFMLRYVDGDVRKLPTKGDDGQWGLTQDNRGQVIFSNAGTGHGPLHFNFPITYTDWKPKWERAEGFRSTWAIDHVDDAQGGRGAMRGDNSLKGFTATCGQSVFRGDRLPAEVQGNLFFGEPVGRLLRRARIDTDPMGRRIIHNVYQGDEKEFIASTDANFRPVNSATGPDGTLYLVDMHRGIIQEGSWVPKGSFIRKAIEHYGLDRNIGRGRIYRLRHPDFQPGPQPRMLDETPAQLVRHLAHPNGWWRDEAQKLIVLSGDRSVIPALREMLAHSADPLARLHALWTLEGFDALSLDQLKPVFRDPHPHLRAAAIRISERFGNLDVLWSLTADPHPDVQIQLILSMSLATGPETRRIADAVLAANPANELLRELDQELNRACFVEQERLADLAKLNAAERALTEVGATHFKSLCATCHGPGGKGVIAPGGQKMAPSLIGNPRVLGDARILTHLALNGFMGPIDGKTYLGGVMAPLKANSDDYLAAVLTYIRKSWGNSAAMITGEQVAETRSEAVGIDEPFTEATLAELALNTGGDWRLWSFDASHKPKDLSKLQDEDADNTWANKSHMRPGMWLSAEFPHPRNIFKAQLFARGDDFAPALKVEVSDGKTWRTVIDRVAGKRMTEIAFPMTVAKSVRFTVLDSKEKWWQLFRVELLGPSMGDIDQYPIDRRDYLTFASAKSAKNGWGRLKQNRAIGGGSLRIAGETFGKGLGVHAKSELIYELTGKGYSRFFAKVGHDDQGFDTNLAFEVWRDDQRVFSSGDLQKGAPAKTVDISLKGASQLRLLVLPGSDGKADGDHADWADACFIRD
jgi:type 1 glutamine amidotransferase/mono/diheme cytochrome c family protein/glucose/arabinose dehydrogenase